MKTGTHTCAVTSKIRRKVDSDIFCVIASHILGPTYDLSVVLIGDTRARALNNAHRGKNTPANVLSFPLSEESGEIFLNVARAFRECKKFDLSPTGHLAYLLIHGCLHLKGYEHGSTMEEAEQKSLLRFHIR
jgi:probable rRNA maturation factor